MGLLNWFGSKEATGKTNRSDSEEKEGGKIPWHSLHTLDQLDEIVEESKTRAVVIFKHSTRCGISSMVLRQFEKSYNIEPNQMKLFFLDLLAYREVSNEVGYRFQVIHQSPQLLVIKNGVPVAHASHSGINAQELYNFI